MSVPLLELIVKLVPAVRATDRCPSVPPVVRRVILTMEFAVICWRVTVTVPPTNVAVPCKSVNTPGKLALVEIEADASCVGEPA